MDLRFTAADEAFRQEVRTFMRDNLPREIAADVRRWNNPRPEYYRRWQSILAEKGWGAPHWPVRWGGTDWSPLRKHIFFEELYRADAPDFGWQATHMVAPVLFAFGTEEQCARFAPKILTGEEFWCQGFSEPGAGSDLANLRTRRSSSATTRSSTARRSGPAMRRTPTGVSSSCAPIRP